MHRVPSGPRTRGAQWAAPCCQAPLPAPGAAQPPLPPALRLCPELAGPPRVLQGCAGGAGAVPERCRSGAGGAQRQEHISERVNRAARAPAPRCLPRSLHFYADWKPALCVLLKLNVRLLILLLVSNEI